MKKANYYFTLCLVLFTTIFSFMNMFQIVKVSSNVIQIVLTNLLPSLLPFMILISLCLSLGLFQLFSYFIQFLFTPLFHLTPHMSSLYFVSFFCGYPTNAKIIKESYELGYINIHQLQHLLSIASFSSLSFIFVSLHLPLNIALFIYMSHITPSLIKALFHKEKIEYLSFQETLYQLKNPHMSFVEALKKSITSSLTAFIFILGYMLVFQFVGYSLHSIIHDRFLLSIIQGFLEFSSGSLQLLKYHHILVYPIVSFYLSFSGLSVLMQVDNILEGIPYSFSRYFKDRLIHGFCSFFICFIIILLFG
ncbi:MAG: hypothetical protein ACLUVC_05765 [Longibaculum sp.]